MASIPKIKTSQNDEADRRPGVGLKFYKGAAVAMTAITIAVSTYVLVVRHFFP